MTTVVEHCTISPAAGTVEFFLPMTFFDMMWYGSPANQSILFFEISGCSKPHFLDTIVPNLKHSLSKTLTHFLPFAGKIIHPLINPGDNKPFIHYVPGDSVPFTVSESDADFSHLSGNHPRACDEFYAFAPNLPQAARSENSIACPVSALQVTLFPGQGLCIGFVTHHVLADASSAVSFVQAWAIINRHIHINNDDIDSSQLLAEAKCLPFYDRESVLDINGLDSIYWNLIVKSSCTIEPPPLKFPIGKVRATFVLTKDEIQKLKNYVLAKLSSVGNNYHLSSFVVIYALVWVCSTKAAAAAGRDQEVDEQEFIVGFVADCRPRMNPPLPANYFGNCVALVRAEMEGDNGLVTAAESIGKAIRDRVYGEKGILHGAERWPEEFEKFTGGVRKKKGSGVAGSPRFDFYAADFGWGRPKKFEALFVDGNGSISLWKSRELEGGLEIGLSRPKAEMEAFKVAFTQVLRDLACINYCI